ncbi:hypothetical protein GOP47_0015831 [Adiantum capillus-veneris]|uniref:Uncharacterized protein n=1 Tax=Adiantum capillus-veneris TaxID=13818 RepID=A0A9D4UKI1_ADICA|nr:hypothetical protein GOP47_0015831 [Adiantum capillus-veneris]
MLPSFLLKKNGLMLTTSGIVSQRPSCNDKEKLMIKLGSFSKSSGAYDIHRYSVSSDCGRTVQKFWIVGHCNHTNGSFL